LALPEVNYLCEWYAGGTSPSALVELAELLVNAGRCKAVLIYRSMNGRSAYRLGGTGREPEASGMWQHRMPYGYLSYPETMAMWCRRHMIEFGTKPDHLGAIAINQRGNAAFNENAMKREPMGADDYLASTMICDPLRLLDMCLESDGACAVLVTRADRAVDCARPPVYIKASAWVGSKEAGSDWADYFLRNDMTENFTMALGKKLYRQSGLTPRDIDSAQIYDCFTHTVLMGLEGLGFCKKGEGGPFAASGAIARDGQIPVNTGGGMLSEAYIHGMNVIAEAVRQLRGDCGPRQLRDARNVIVTSGAWVEGSGLILSNEKGN
jgi:acetyl-CoA acetyltransferase